MNIRIIFTFFFFFCYVQKLTSIGLAMIADQSRRGAEKKHKSGLKGIWSKIRVPREIS